MQTGKSAMASAKEAVANVGASAKSGMDKTKAVIEEKAEKMTAHHPAEKEIAERRKAEKLMEAEMRKQEAMHHNAAAKEHVATGYNRTGAAASTTPAAARAEGYGPAAAAASPVPHGDRATEGVVQSRPSAAHNPRVGGGDVETGYGTGGHYT